MYNLQLFISTPKYYETQKVQILQNKILRWISNVSIYILHTDLHILKIAENLKCVIVNLITTICMSKF